jgi:DNA invertase Pin-like site-specific DNA recombinase
MGNSHGIDVCPMNTATNDIAIASRKAGDRLRLVALTRISKDRDNETSTATQPFEMQQWADSHNMEIVEWLEEIGKSGFKTIPRPRLNDALNMVRTGVVDGLIVWKIDRFTRKGAIEIFRMLSVITDENVNGFLIASHDNIDTRNNDMVGIIKLTVMAEVAKAESEAKSDRAKSWHAGRKRNVATPIGRRPFGYDRPDRNTLIVNEEEAHCIRIMAKDVLKGKSIRLIARELNESGIRADDQPEWTHRGVQYVLKSATTCGGRIVAGEFVKGDWKAIISRETQLQIIDALSGADRRTSFRNTASWLLSAGVAKCGNGECEGKFRMKQHPQGMRYTCLVCASSVRMDMADEVVNDAVLAMFAGDAWKELRAQGRTHDSSAIEFLTNQLAFNEQRWLAGKMTNETFAEREDEINARIAAIQDAPIVMLPNVEDLVTAWNDDSMMTLDQKRQVLFAATEITIMPYAKRGMNTYDRVIVERTK